MPFQIQGDAKTTRIIISGQITLAEIADLGRELARVEAGFETVPDRLTDLSAIENGDFDYATVEQLAKRSCAQVYPRRFKSAIVAPKLLNFALARMFQTLSSNPKIDLRVFKELTEAEAWLASKH